MGKASGKKQTSSNAGKQAASSFFHKPFLHVLLICILGFLAYSNTFQSPFQWDEADYIVGNPIIRNLGYFTDISRAKDLPVYDGLRSRYIGYLTFALNYKMHGFNVFGYHVVNLAIHLINAVLVYFFVLLTLRTPFFQRPGTRDQGPGISNKGHQSRVTSSESPVPSHQSRITALAVALLFVAHPLQTEAVTYIFQRLASLVSLFYLMSLVLYIKGRQIQVEAMTEVKAEVKAKEEAKTELQNSASAFPSTSALTCFILSFVSAVLAMKTKENAFTLPVIITLYELLFFIGPLKPRLFRLAPFLLTMLIVPLTIMGASGTPGEIIGQVKDPASQGYITPAPADYLFTQFRVIATYLRLLFLPIGQNFDYDYPLYHSFFESPVLISFVCLASLFGAAVYLIYRSGQAARLTSRQEAMGYEQKNIKPSTNHKSLFTIHFFRLIGFGILWFFITLSVESSIIPIPMLINEYRSYLPSVGFFIALVAGIMLLFKQTSRVTSHESQVTVFGTVLFTLIILVLASATYARNMLWSEKISLWEDTVRKSPSPRGYNNLGIAYYEKGLQNEAIGMYELAISKRPNYESAYMNLGVAYAVTGRIQAALQKFEEVIAMNPKNSAAYLNLARAYTDLGRPYDAIENFRTAIALDPNSNTAFHGLGTAYARLGMLDDALAAYTRFVELSPRDPEAYRNRGLVYQAKGDMANTLEDFQQACSLGSRDSCEFLERLR